MKLVTYISTGVFIVLSACIMKKEAVQQNGLYGKKWELKQVYTDDGVKDVSGKPFIKFDREKSSAGGHAGCNTFGSKLEVRGKQIKLENIFSTKMYCEQTQETENIFLKNLGLVNRYEIRSGVLNLFRDGSRLLVLEPTSEQ